FRAPTIANLWQQAYIFMTTSRTQAPKNYSSTAESPSNEDLSNRQHKEHRKAKDNATTDQGKTVSRDAARTRTAHPPSRRAPSSYAPDSRRSEPFKLKKRNDRPTPSDQGDNAKRTPSTDEARLQ